MRTTASCLGCGRPFQVPEKLIRRAEHYNGKPVMFCRRACNVRFVEEAGRRGQEEKMRALIKRLENK